jgi:hypothetical protein
MSKYGQLEPIGGGDSIPLRFKNVSAHHCQLYINTGYWFARDLNSRNGTRVEGIRVNTKRLDPGCSIQFAKHIYTMDYDPADLGATGPPPADDDAVRTVLGRSLLSRAGLERREHSTDHKRRPHEQRRWSNRRPQQASVKRRDSVSPRLCRTHNNGTTQTAPLQEI